jgi:hypothetical protein
MGEEVQAALRASRGGSGEIGGEAGLDPRNRKRLSAADGECGFLRLIANCKLIILNCQLTRVEGASER